MRFLCLQIHSLNYESNMWRCVPSFLLFRYSADFHDHSAFWVCTAVLRSTKWRLWLTVRWLNSLRCIAVVPPYVFHLIDKETPAQVFSCELCEIVKNTFLYRTPSIATSKCSCTAIMRSVCKTFFHFTKPSTKPQSCGNTTSWLFFRLANYDSFNQQYINQLFIHTLVSSPPTRCLFLRKISFYIHENQISICHPCLVGVRSSHGRLHKFLSLEKFPIVVKT